MESNSTETYPTAGSAFQKIKGSEGFVPVRREISLNEARVFRASAIPPNDMPCESSETDETSESPTSEFYEPVLRGRSKITSLASYTQMEQNQGTVQKNTYDGYFYLEMFFLAPALELIGFILDCFDSHSHED